MGKRGPNYARDHAAERTSRKKVRLQLMLDADIASLLMAIAESVGESRSKTVSRMIQCMAIIRGLEESTAAQLTSGRPEARLHRVGAMCPGRMRK